MIFDVVLPKGISYNKTTFYNIDPRFRNVLVWSSQQPATTTTASTTTTEEQSRKGQNGPHREAVAAAEKLLSCQSETWCADEGAACRDDRPESEGGQGLVPEQEVQGQEEDANEAEQGNLLHFASFSFF